LRADLLRVTLEQLVSYAGVVGNVDQGEAIFIDGFQAMLILRTDEDEIARAQTQDRAVDVVSAPAFLQPEYLREIVIMNPGGPVQGKRNDRLVLQHSQAYQLAPAFVFYHINMPQ